MKKIKFLVFGVLIFSVFCFIAPTLVKALSNETLTETPINNAYYTRRGGGQPYFSAQYNTYSMNGKAVYCIEPGVNIDTYSYVGENGFVLIEAPYSTATNKKIELIGHYGYDYPGHQTLRYRMATQSLIWEETGGQIVEFWTEKSGFGDFINLNYERNQIMNLVNKHYDKPTFHNSSYNVTIGQEFTVTDTSGILNQYQVYSSDGLEVRIEGNTLHIKALRTGNLQLNMTRKHYDSATTMVFKGLNVRSQNMGYFRFSDPVTAFLNVHSVGGRISINKLDNDTNSKTTHGEATLTGAVYDIYDSNNKLVDTLTVDSTGNAISKYLELGTYFIKEITASKGYLLDPIEYEVTITEEQLNITVTSKEQVIKRDIEILKSYSLNGTGILIPEENITFEIYNRNNVLVQTITTDKQGYAKIIGLPFGLYQVKQVNAPSGINKVQDFNFSVEENSPTTIRFNIVNDQVQTYLRLIKKDFETGKIIPFAGIKFKIFDINKNEYVTMKVTYPTAKLIDTFETDSTGIFITPEMLNTGHYRIEEVDQAINGYLWNKDSLEFYIDGNSDISYNEAFGFIMEMEFYNTQVKGNINIHKEGEKLVLENDSYIYEKISLEGVRFGLYASEDIIVSGHKYYSKNELITELITDEFGNIEYGNLPLGKYYVKELESVNDNLLDNTAHYFELKYKDQYTEIVYTTLTLENRLSKGKLEFTKTDLVNDIGLPNTKISIFTEDDILIFSGITDEFGKIIIDDLFVGRFYILETEAPEGYILNTEKMWFEITSDGEIVKANMTNELIVDVPNTGINTVNLAYIGGSILILVGLGVILYGKKKK